MKLWRRGHHQVQKDLSEGFLFFFFLNFWNDIFFPPKWFRNSYDEWAHISQRSKRLWTMEEEEDIEASKPYSAASFWAGRSCSFHSGISSSEICWRIFGCPTKSWRKSLQDVTILFGSVASHYKFGSICLSWGDSVISGADRRSTSWSLLHQSGPETPWVYTKGFFLFSWCLFQNSRRYYWHLFIRLFPRKMNPETKWRE